MPIELSPAAEEGGSPSVLGHPVIVCDHCGRRVADAAGANVAWGPGSPRLRYVHKGCLEGFIGREFDPREGEWGVGELDTFLHTLLANAGYDAERTARRGSGEIPWGNLGA